MSGAAAAARGAWWNAQPVVETDELSGEARRTS
jgi:hypothetical protein